MKVIYLLKVPQYGQIYFIASRNVTNYFKFDFLIFNKSDIDSKRVLIKRSNQWKNMKYNKNWVFSEFLDITTISIIH